MSDIQGYVDLMGTDHASIHKDTYSAPLGMAKGSLDHHDAVNFERSSKPEDPEEIKKIEAENVAAEKEDKKGLPPKKPKKTKQFEEIAKRALLDIEFKELGAKLANRSTDIIAKANQICSEVDGNTSGLKDLFSQATLTLQHRLKILTKAHKPDSEEHATSGFAKKHEEQFQKFIKDKEVKEWYDQKNKDPYDKLFEMHSLSYVLEKLVNYEVKSEEEVKLRKKEMREHIALYNGLVVKVSEQTSRLSHAFRKRVDAQLDDEVKKRDEAQQKREDESKKRQAAARLQANSKRSKCLKYQIFDHLGHFDAIEQVDELKEWGVQTSKSEPALIDFDEDQLKMDAAQKKDFGIFWEEFRKAPVYGTSGRGSKQIVKDPKLFNAMLKDSKFVTFGKLTKDNLSVAEQRFAESPWWWGYAAPMKSAGLEYNFMCSLKLNTMGERDVLAVPVHDIEQMILKQKPDNTVISLQECCDFVTEVLRVLLS